MKKLTKAQQRAVEAIRSSDTVKIGTPEDHVVGVRVKVGQDYSARDHAGGYGVGVRRPTWMRIIHKFEVLMNLGDSMLIVRAK